MLDEYIDNKIILFKKIKSRKFHVSILDGYDVNVSIDKSKLSGKIIENVIFYQFVVQSTKKIYIVAASEFNIFDYLNREPYMQSGRNIDFKTNWPRL